MLTKRTTITVSLTLGKWELIAWFTIVTDNRQGISWYFDKSTSTGIAGGAVTIVPPKNPIIILKVVPAIAIFTPPHVIFKAARVSRYIFCRKKVRILRIRQFVLCRTASDTCLAWSSLFLACSMVKGDVEKSMLLRNQCRISSRSTYYDLLDCCAKHFCL